jgi:hypothetical protein
MNQEQAPSGEAKDGTRSRHDGCLFVRGFMSVALSGMTRSLNEA